MRPRPPVDEIRVRDLGAPAGLHATADDQPVLIREGKRPEHDRIGQREQGGVRTDPEREERDGDERQLGPCPHGAERLAQRHHWRQHNRLPPTMCSKIASDSAIYLEELDRSAGNLDESD